MLGKLIKHEFRGTAGYMGLIFLGLLGFSTLARLLSFLTEIFNIFSIPLILVMSFYVIFAAASFILVYVLIIRRFYVNVYGDIGYLTLTLPVERWKITVSKLIVSLVWLIATAAVLIASIVIVSFSREFLDVIVHSLDYLYSLISYFAEFLSIPLWLLGIEAILLIIISSIFSILSFYTSISIGQLFTGHRLIVSVVGYFMISAASNIIMKLYTVFIGLTTSDINVYARQFSSGAVLNGYASFNMQVYIIIYLLIIVAMTILIYLLNNRIMKHSVNLQ